MATKPAGQLPRGVRIRSNKLQITFYYDGVRYREMLQLEPTPKNMKYAEQLKAAIEFDISQGKFDYAKYFPNSKNAEKFKQNPTLKDITMEDLLNKQLELYKRRRENGNLCKSTLRGYKNSINAHLIPGLGKYKVSELDNVIIREWFYTFNCRTKTIRNTLTPLHKVLNTAKIAGLIKANFLEEIDLSDIIEEVGTAKKEVIEPFDDFEKNYLIDQATGQFKNFVQFAFWSGLRTGELIALKWRDIDFKNKLIYINENIVCHEEKKPKTSSGTRSVLILPKAEEALKEQFKFTGNLNKYVFHHPKFNQPWKDDQQIRNCWKKLFKDRKVKYRYPYQTRHTYASTLLSNGENIAWLATQMGHINTQMIIENYGKFIPNRNLIGGYELKGKY